MTVDKTAFESATDSATPLSLAIVGHTNTGKTSLIRTLLRRGDFGSVMDAAGTTRHVEAATLMAANEPVIELFDTPGLEDSMALLETLNRLKTEPAPSGRERLQHLVNESEKHPDFAQEIKVLRQALRSDILFYIIDVREPVLGKYRDEIAILSMAARPIIPVLNFIAIAPQNLERWRAALAEFNLHALVEFDTVAFDFEAEKRLYQKLQSVVEHRYQSLQRLIDYRSRHWQALQQAATRQVAELLIGVASYRHPLARGEQPQSLKAAIQNRVREAERACLANVLAIFEFSDADMEHHPLPVTDGNWNRDLFDPDALREFGLDAGSAAAKGAVVGAGIDLMVAGLSLGTASAAGALVGATWSTARRYGRDLLAKIRGQHWFCVDDDTVKLVFLRQLQLLQTLLHRGHAAQNKITLKQDITAEVPADWQARLKKMRNHPQWSLLDPANDRDDWGRARFAADLATWIAALLRNNPQ